MPFGAIVFLRTKFLEKLKKGWNTPLGVFPILVGGTLCLQLKKGWNTHLGVFPGTLCLICDFCDFYAYGSYEFYLEEYY